MKAWVTNNPLSHAVLESTGLPTQHIIHFADRPPVPSVFYGILRGAGPAMQILKYLKINYWYIDNGYFDAEYVDASMHKDMSGKFRVVMNDTVEPYEGIRIDSKVNAPKRALLIPPSQYSAHHYNTTPEDWIEYCRSNLPDYEIRIRHKDSRISLEDSLSWCGMMVSMHSMSCMKAIEMGIPTYDSHGIFRNIRDIEEPDFQPTFVATLKNVREFYEPKQYTLQELGNLWL